MAEQREGILSALGQYARGAAEIPQQVIEYGQEVVESEAPLTKVKEDVTALGTGIVGAIAEDPVQFGLEMLPGVGNYMAFREAENLREQATLAREEGDEDRASGLEAAATYAMSGVVPGGNILKALRKGAGDVVKMQQDPTTGARTATLQRPFKTRGRDFLETLDGDFPEQDLVNRIQKAGLPATDTEMILQSITEASKDNKGRVSRFDLLDKYADKSIEDRTFIDIQEPIEGSGRYGNMDNVHGASGVGVIRLGVDYKDPVDSRGRKLFSSLTDPLELLGFAKDMGSLETKISQLYEVNPDIADIFDSRKTAINKSVKKYDELNSDSLAVTALKSSYDSMYSVAPNPYMRKALEQRGISVDQWNDMMTSMSAEIRERAVAMVPELKQEGGKIAVDEVYDLIKNADLKDPKYALARYEINQINDLRNELDNIPSADSAFMFGTEELKKKLIGAASTFKDGQARRAKKVVDDEIGRIKNELNRKGLFASEIGELPTEHSGLNIDKSQAIPLSFMRYVDVDAFTRDANGTVTSVNPVMHMMELQSDYDDLLRKHGPRGKGGRKGDLMQDDMLLGEQLELEVKLDDMNNRKADLLGDDVLDDPAFIADETKRKEFESLDRQSKSLESQIMSIKGQRKTISKRLSKEFTDSEGKPAPYDVAELYPGQGQRSQVQQVNDIVAATLASIQRDKTGVTFPVPDPTDSAQSQLYANIMNNAREAAKRLGPDFEVRLVDTIVTHDIRGNPLAQQEFRKRVGIFHQDAETARSRAAERRVGNSLEEIQQRRQDLMDTQPRLLSQARDAADRGDSAEVDRLIEEHNRIGGDIADLNDIIDRGESPIPEMSTVPNVEIGKGGKGVKMFEMGGIVSLPRQSRGKEGIVDVIRKYRRDGTMY